MKKRAPIEFKRSIMQPSGLFSTMPANSAGYLACAGPVLLEDFQTIEKLATLHRERIPPRVVHAKGAAAKGYFQV